MKTLHVVAVISWMAGMLYLFRLFVYHAQESVPEVMQRFEVMERRLLRAITTPAMIVAVGSGAYLLSVQSYLLAMRFMQVKLALVGGMLVMHALGARWRRRLIAQPRFRPHRFFRVMNEVPTLLMIGIVILIIVRPALR
jgi:putative membrane protein